MSYCKRCGKKLGGPDDLHTCTSVDAPLQDLIEQCTEVIEPDDPDYRYEYFNAKRFARLVAAREREACAQILDRNVALCGTNLMMRDVLAGNALAIRARETNG